MAVESPIGKQIREVLATSLRRDPSSIKPEHSLRDDLGLDSLMTFELLYDLEKAFDLEIPNDDLPGLQTFGDVVKYVEVRVNPDVMPSTPHTTEKKPATTKPTKATPSTPTAKRKASIPAKGKKPAPTAKTRTPSKHRPAAPSTKRAAATASSKKRTASTKPKAKKK